MPITIVSYEWHLGNGVVSTAESPTTIYRPGTYDVTLIAGMSDGSTVTVHEEKFISISEDQQNQINPSYVENPVSLHYGINPSVANGWSRSSGDEWVWPESQAAVSHETVSGVDSLLVWDMYDDRQYCINPRNTSFSTINHKDKDTTDIRCSVTFGAVKGESDKYDIMHQETTFQLRKDIDTKTLPSDMTVEVSLIGSEGNVLETQRMSGKNEIVFKEQMSYNYGEHKSIQLKLDSDKSGYLMNGLDSVYKTDDKSATAIYGRDGDTESTENVIRSTAYWLNRKNYYSYEMITKVENQPVTIVAGLDSGDIAMRFVSNFVVSTSGYTSIMFWYKGNRPSIAGLVDVYEHPTSLYKLVYTNEHLSSITINAAVTDVYDFRMFNGYYINDRVALDYALHVNDYQGAF